MTEPRVGIVIPAYNAGEFVVEAAESAMAALGSRQNIVIVDDGSTDLTSREALGELTRRGFTVLRQPNCGVSAARNAGIAAVHVPYVLTLDADDLVHPRAPTIAADVLDAYDDVAIVTGSMIKFDENGVHTVPLPPVDATRHGMRRQTRIHVGSAFRVADWAESDGFPENLRFGEDWVFWMRLLRLRPQIRVTETVFNFRREHSGQVTSKYIDPRESSKATLLVMRENPDIVAEYLDEFIEAYASSLETLSAYRHAYRKFDAAKKRSRAIVKRMRGSR